jgi:glycosyltransferase involved in cell wall biosynthesis
MGSFVVKKDYLHKRLYSRVDKAFAISKVIENNLIETTPLSRDKTSILHNGVDVNRFTPENKNREKIRYEFNIKEDELLLGMTARFTPGKGHEEFLEAAKAISGQFKNVKFLIVGEPSRGESEYAERIYRLSKDFGLDDKVIFTGFRSDIPDILSALDVFVFPSHAEAFGISLAEAMAAGKACVASDSDGPLDIIDDELNGLFFETGNADDLTNKLIMLIKESSLRRKLSEQARIKALRDFDIEKLTDKTIVHYKELIKKKGV